MTSPDPSFDRSLQDIQQAEQIGSNIWTRIDLVTRKWRITADRWDRECKEGEMDIAANTLRRAAQDIESLRPLHMGSVKDVDECPRCKLKASTGLHRFCTRGVGECPLR